MRDDSSSCLIPRPVPSRLVSSRFVLYIYTMSAAPRNFIEFAAERAAFHGQLWRPTLCSPSALYSAILNPPTYNPRLPLSFSLTSRDVGEKSYASSAFFASICVFSSVFADSCISSRISFLQLVSIVALTRLLTASLIPFTALSTRSARRDVWCIAITSFKLFLQETP